MTENTGKKQNKIKVTVFIIVVFMIVVGCTFLLGMDGNVCSEETYVDDQRSTLWPVLVSLIATMLGSLITSYVFLKEALDRTSDEKLYYSVVIREYREKTMRHLWIYTLSSIAVMGLVIWLYSIFYFMHLRSKPEIRICLVVLYCLCMLGSAWFLNQCIDIDRGLHRTANSLISRRSENARRLMSKIECDKRKDYLSGEVYEDFEALSRRIIGSPEKPVTLINWLQINMETEKTTVDIKKFISRFSEWERILFCLVEKGEGFLGRQSMQERVRFAIEQGESVYEGKKVEESDALEHTWGNNVPYKYMSGIKNSMRIDGTKFCDVYSLLAEIRDLYQVQLDTSQKRETGAIEKYEGVITNLFLFFLMQLSLYVFCMLPKIEIFYPSGKFCYADFYGVRFENSSFRTSLFEYSLFVRNRIKGCNFGMTLFRNCEFYYSSCEDCSFTNTYFENCYLQNTSFEDVDFTGAEMAECDLSCAEFDKTVVSNVTLRDIMLGKNKFVSSRLTHVIIELGEGKNKIELNQCGFPYSVIKRIKIELFPKEDYKEVFSLIWSDAKREKKYILKPQKPRGGELLLLMQDTWHRILEKADFRMDQCDFTGSILENIVFYRTNLEQSIFEKAQMDSVQICASNLRGCIMEQANLRQAKIQGSVFCSGVLSEAIFYRSRCSIVNFEDSGLRSLHASEANFTLCSFERSDCSRIDLTKSKVKESSFKDAILTEAELTNAMLDRVSFENCIADGMLSSYSTFDGCILKNAFLGRSSFNYTRFKNCRFDYTSFADSTVSGAEFDGCDFKEANFNQTCFIKVKFKNSRHLQPDSFKGARFIDPVFEGTDQYFDRLLIKYGVEVRRTEDS